MRLRAQQRLALKCAILLFAYAHACLAAPELTNLAADTTKQPDVSAIIEEFSELVDRAVGHQPVYDHELLGYKSTLIKLLVDDANKDRVVDILNILLQSTYQYKTIQYPETSIVFTINYAHGFLASLSTRKAINKLLDEYEFWDNSSSNYSIPQLISGLDKGDNLDIDRYLAIRKLRDNSYRFIYDDRILNTYNNTTLYEKLFNDINESNINKALDTLRVVPDQHAGIYAAFNDYLIKSHADNKISDESFNHARYILAQVYKPARTPYEQKIFEAEGFIKNTDLAKLPANKLSQILKEIRYTEPKSDIEKSRRDNENQNIKIKAIRHAIIDYYINSNNEYSINSLQAELSSIAQDGLYHAYAGYANKAVAYKYNNNNYFDDINKIARHLSDNRSSIDQVKYILTMYELGFDYSSERSLALIYYENKTSKIPPDPVFNEHRSETLYNAMLAGLGKLYSNKYLEHLLTYDSKPELAATLKGLNLAYLNSVLSEAYYKDGLTIMGKTYDPASAFLNDLEPYHIAINM